MTNLAESAIPTKVSNGRLIKQLELWGWTQHRSKGDRVIYEHSLYLDRLTVMAAHIHQGNSPVMLRKVYDTVTGGNASLFWARRAPAMVSMKDALEETFQSGRFDPVEMASTPIILPTENHTTIVAVFDHDDHPEGGTYLGSGPVKARSPKPEAKKEEPAVTATPQHTHQHRGTASKVFQYLNDHPHDTVTAAVIARRTNLDGRAIGNALNYLCGLGHVDRLVRGTYRLSPSLAADKVVRHEHTGGVEVPRQTATPKPASKPENPAISAAPMASVTPITKPHVASAEDDLDALLELVLPTDYVFQPSHLRAMRKWQDATAELLRTLRGES